jgi:hypothetical protein
MAVAGCVDISAGESHMIERVEKRYTVTGTPQVKVGTFDGRVTVSTWDRPEVLVTIEKYAMDQASADRMEVVATQDGDRIDVQVRQERLSGLNFNFGPHGARLIVSLPARSVLDAASGDGRIEVRDLEGDLTVRTGDGAIRLENVTGSVNARSGDGSVSVDGAPRSLHVRSGDGRVAVRAAPGTKAESEWDISTGDGSVVLEVPEGFGAELDASTGDGRVTVRDVPYSGASGSREHRASRGRIGDGGPTIRIRSGDGSIAVRRIDS